MDNLYDFENIRPYKDDEVPQAMRRIASDPLFETLAAYAFPGIDVKEVRARILDIKTKWDFQLGVMKPAADQIISRTISDFTYGGIENLSSDDCFLFVSNHRDIVLDAMLLQYILHENGYSVGQITFGSNLMQNQLVIDIGKTNKMFRVERGGTTAKEFYLHSMQNSAYIRHVICEEKESVWIAQRNGRTKNGYDVTEPGLIKMFGMSGTGDKVKAISDLHITPVSISYEWEPCDIEKAVELYISQRTTYTKKPGEDLQSILKGINQYKGHVHIEVGQRLSYEDLKVFSECTSNDFNKNVALLLDERIQKGYRLMANNYIACDLLNGDGRFADKYSDKQKSDFVNHLNSSVAFPNSNFDEKELRSIFLKIYASPVLYTNDITLGN